jgi:predicted RNA binding protein YcfA (HicA-like mRNA interferase family)
LVGALATLQRYTQLLAMKPRDLIGALEADGWYEVGQKGSHRQFRHPRKSSKVTVPVHPGRDLTLRNVKSIERQSGLKLLR